VNGPIVTTPCSTAYDGSQHAREVKTLPVLVATAALGLAVAGCSPSDADIATDLRGRSFVAVATSGFDPAPPEGLTVEVPLEGPLRATAGCDASGGEFVVRDGRLVITEGLAVPYFAASDECIGRVSGYAKWLEALVTEEPLVEHDGDRVTLTGPVGSLTLVEVTPALTEVVWRLRRVDPTAGPLANPRPAQVVFSGAGSVVVGRGGVTGTVVLDGDDMSVEIEAPETIEDREKVVVDLLRGSTTWQVDGTVLTVRTMDGTVATFTPQGDGFQRDR